MRKRSMITMGALLAAYALTTNVSYGALQQSYGTSATEVGGTDAYTNSGVSVSHGATLTITGTENLSVTMDGADERVAMDITGANLTAENLNITVTPGDKAVNNRPKGMIVRGASDTNIDNLNVTVTKSNRDAKTSNSPDSDAAYGVAVGYDYNGGNPGDTTKFTVNNATIKVNNTADSVKGHYTNGLYKEKKVFFFTAKAQGDFLSGYQLSGIKIYRSDKATPQFHATGDVNIEVEDKSTAKVADYNVGIYISGDNASAIFDGNTNIRVTGNGLNSAGIKIGKPKDSGTVGNATVTVNGKLNIDTTSVDGTYTFGSGSKAQVLRGSGAVRLFDKGSTFNVTGQKTKEASFIKASTNGIVFDTVDYENLGTVVTNVVGTKNEMLTRGTHNEHGTASLYNTQITTISYEDDLILANARFKKEEDVYKLADLAKKAGLDVRSKLDSHFQTGAMNVKNAQFTLSGEKSEATAAKKGWAIRAKSENAEATT